MTDPDSTPSPEQDAATFAAAPGYEAEARDSQRAKLYGCTHFWSITDWQGMQECLWCRETRYTP